LLHPGATFTWRFHGSVEHDVTLATGPAGFASPSMHSGTFTYRFTRRGTYRLFCSLHPARMTQLVIVR
jgi:plastocyanin